MKYLLLLFSSVIVFSCASTQVALDYDEQKDFTQYKTYNYFPSMQSGLNELDMKRIMSVSDSLLLQKGFVKSDSADIYVNFKTQTLQQPTNNTIGVGVGGGNGGLNIGLGGGIPIGGPVTMMQLTVDFVDVKEDALIWQSVNEKRFRPNARGPKRIEFFKAILQDAYSKYPPKKKK